MKQNDIKDLPRLSIENFEKIFNVYQDADGLYFYNLLNTIVFPQNLPVNLFTVYTVKPGDTWPFISYKTLQSPNLWWIILLANGIDNPLLPVVPGTNLKIPISQVVKEVVEQAGR